MVLDCKYLEKRKEKGKKKEQIKRGKKKKEKQRNSGKKGENEKGKKEEVNMSLFIVERRFISFVS